MYQTEKEEGKKKKRRENLVGERCRQQEAGFVIIQFYSILGVFLFGHLIKQLVLLSISTIIAQSRQKTHCYIKTSQFLQKLTHIRPLSFLTHIQSSFTQPCQSIMRSFDRHRCASDSDSTAYPKHFRLYQKISNMGLQWQPVLTECDSTNMGDTSTKPKTNHTCSNTNLKQEKEKFGERRKRESCLIPLHCFIGLQEFKQKKPTP